MNNESSLHIYFNTQSDEVTNSYIITEQIKSLEGDKVQEWFSSLSKLSIETEEKLSYQTFLPYIIQPGKGGLPICVTIYQDIISKMDRRGYKELVTHNLDGKYRSIIDDVAEAREVTVKHNYQKEHQSNQIISPGVILFIIDSIIACLFNLFNRRLDDFEGGHLFFPFPDRYDSLTPVIKSCPNNALSIVTPLFTSWKFRRSNHSWPNELPAATMAEFTDFQTIVKQVRELVNLQWAVLFGEIELSNKLAATIKNEYGLSLKHTTQHLIEEIAKGNIRQILTLYLAINVVDKLDYETVTVGGDSPRDRYILMLADKKGMKTYYVPHSIQYRNKLPSPVISTTQFICGIADKELIEEVYDADYLPNLEVTGRPYLDGLEMDENLKCKEYRIIVATQPYPEWIRERFLRLSIDSIKSSNFSGDVIVKIHPSESKSDYQRLIGDQFKESSSIEIKVKEGDIRDSLSQNSILITMNSNVGLESILQGSYCISFNPCEPFVTPSSYIDGEYIPYRKSVGGLSDELDCLAGEEITHVQKGQLAHISRSYKFGDSAARICRIINGMVTHK